MLAVLLALVIAAGPQLGRIIDGDTIVLRDGNHVRILGIDTPERGECGFQEATGQLARLIAGDIKLSRDLTQDNRDRYGRLLRYIEDDGRDVGLELVRRGYAESYQKYRVGRSKLYDRAAIQAWQHGRGLWRVCGHP